MVHPAEFEVQFNRLRWFRPDALGMPDAFVKAGLQIATVCSHSSFGRLLSGLLVARYSVQEPIMRWAVLLPGLAASFVLLVAGCIEVPKQQSAGVERLYILNCGEGIAGDISRWSPGVNVGKSMPFADNCYLIKHAKGWMLWDTGLADAIAAMPNGQAPADPRAIHWYRPKTLASQLEALGVKPESIAFVAISHSHPDHIGNLEMFPKAMLLVQKAEYEWPTPNQVPRFNAQHPVTALQGDYDIFGDGTVRILSTPGHTPGHQSLILKLPKTGTVVLSGDAAHFMSNWEHRRVPSINADGQKTVTSMQRIADILATEHAQLWINHDKAQRDSLKMAPAYYE
jgi:Zn-dependent hydrolases, including glyoxylases